VKTIGSHLMLNLAVCWVHSKILGCLTLVRGTTPVLMETRSAVKVKAVNSILGQQ
jgi:hypothetical protein